MKLLREFYMDQSEVKTLYEKIDGKVDNIYITGIFAQSSVKNRNGRIYPDHILERECYNLNKEIAQTNGIAGELDHPVSPEIKLQNAAILIESIKKDGNNYIGKAKILKETRHGVTAWGLAKAGYKFGTSTRGLGTTSLKEGVTVVNEDFKWISNDLVSSPSAPDAWVESILEQKEFYIENGLILEDVAMSYYNKLHKLPKAQLEEGIVNLFQDWLNQK